MAVGVRSFGAGTRGITPARFGVTPATGGEDTTDFDTNIDWGDTGITGLTSTSTSGGSSAAAIQNAATTRAKFEAEQAAAAAAADLARTGALRSTDYFRNLLASGVDLGGLEEQIAAQESAGQQYITDQYGMLSGLLGQRRGQALDLTQQGYDALQRYLEANPLMAYRETAGQMPTVTQNALAQYMASRGVSGAPAQAGVDVANAQLAAQAANYNQLLNVLQGAEAQQQTSRLAEQEMARRTAGTQLESIYGTATSNLEAQRLAALNDLASRVASARLQAEQTRIAREQAIQDAIGKLLGTGYVPPTETEVPPVTVGGGVEPTPGRVQQTAVEALAAKLPGIRSTTLANKIATFVATNPNATTAQVKKAFPKLAQNIG